MMRIEVPMVPPSPNELRRQYRHYHTYGKLRDKWEHALFYLIPLTLRSTIKTFAMHNRMRVAITIYHTKPYDPDNLAGCLKPVLDALRNVGYIRDDTAQWIQLDTPKQFVGYAGAARKTVIDLEPLTRESEAA